LVADLKRRVNDTLSLFPESGAKAQDGWRLLTIRRYTYVYRHDAAKGEVVVLDVFGPGMDWR
jgi:plasmid stabilization system protein ParE